MVIPRSRERSNERDLLALSSKWQSNSTNLGAIPANNNEFAN